MSRKYGPSGSLVEEASSRASRPGSDGVGSRVGSTGAGSVGPGSAIEGAAGGSGASTVRAWCMRVGLPFRSTGAAVEAPASISDKTPVNLRSRFGVGGWVFAASIIRRGTRNTTVRRTRLEWKFSSHACPGEADEAQAGNVQAPRRGPARSDPSRWYVCQRSARWAKILDHAAVPRSLMITPHSGPGGTTGSSCPGPIAPTPTPRNARTRVALASERRVPRSGGRSWGRPDPRGRPRSRQRGRGQGLAAWIA